MLILLLLILTSNCKKDDPTDIIHYTYKLPEQINDGWEVASLSEVGMDVSIIEKISIIHLISTNIPNFIILGLMCIIQQF